MIDKSKTLWVPIKAPLGPYMQWTIPAVVTEINKVPLNLPVFSDFQDDLLLYNQIMPKQLVNTKNIKK